VTERSENSTIRRRFSAVPAAVPAPSFVVRCRRVVDQEPGRKQPNFDARRVGVAALLVEHRGMTQSLESRAQFGAELLTQEGDEAFLLHRSPARTGIAPILKTGDDDRVFR
jgi:hypothetical protein